MHICGILKNATDTSTLRAGIETQMSSEHGDSGRGGWDELGDYKLTYVH